MKKLHYFFVLLTVTFLHAQDINVIIEKNYFKATDEEQFLKGMVLLPNNEKLMVYESDHKGFPIHFQKFDAAGKLLKESKYDVKNSYVKDVIVKGNIIYIIHQGYNDESNTTELFINAGNAADLKFTSQKLVSFPSKGRVSSNVAFNASPKDSFVQTTLNKDKSAIAVYADTKGNKDKDIRKVIIFNLSGEIVTEYTYSQENKDAVFFCRDFYISDDGKEVFMIGDVRERVAGNGKMPYMELQKLTAGQMQRIKLTIDKSAPRLLALVPKADKLSIVGCYGGTGTMWISGFCYFDVDPTAFALKTSKFHQFPEQFNIDKFGKPKSKEIADADAFREIFVLPSGDILFSIEAESYMSFETGHYVNYEDIAVARISDSGSLLWARNINKDQNGLRNYCLSYKSVLKGDDLHFFLNAEEDVKDLGKGRPEFKNGRENAADFMVVKLDGQGKLTYKKVLDNKEKIVTPNPQFCIDAEEPGSFYIFGQSDENKLLAKIKL